MMLAEYPIPKTTIWDRVRCLLGKHVWWVQLGNKWSIGEVEDFRDFKVNKDEAKMFFEHVKPDGGIPIRFCIHCNKTDAIFVNEKWVEIEF